MKATGNRKVLVPAFEPIELSITLESEEEATFFYRLFNTSHVAELMPQSMNRGRYIRDALVNASFSAEGQDLPSLRK